MYILCRKCQISLYQNWKVLYDKPTVNKIKDKLQNGLYLQQIYRKERLAFGKFK